MNGGARMLDQELCVLPGVSEACDGGHGVALVAWGPCSGTRGGGGGEMRRARWGMGTAWWRARRRRVARPTVEWQPGDGLRAQTRVELALEAAWRSTEERVIGFIEIGERERERERWRT